MLTGMVAQMFTGNAAGLVRVYELHVLFRCLSASTCALMYTSGQMICKSNFFYKEKRFYNFQNLFTQWQT